MLHKRHFQLRLSGLLGLLWASASLHAVDLSSLKTWGEEKPFAAEYYQGSIIVLDFFAFWCVPCRQVTPALESDIVDHYAAVEGNPAGVAVHVLPINIESAQPKRTDRFIKATGARHVHYDPDATLFAELGQNTGLPFLAVVDWTGDEPVVVYRHAGYEGAEALRAVIDQVRNPS